MAREFDPETSLYYYRARYYDPAIGRFASEDPIKFWGGNNFYAYIHNNAVNFGDPYGLTDYKPATNPATISSAGLQRCDGRVL